MSTARSHEFDNLSIQSLRNRCVLTLAAVAAIVLLMQFFAFSRLRTMDGDAELVNIAGRQRMLSQRLPRLVERYGRSKSDSARQVFRDHLTLFTTSHNRILLECDAKSGSSEDYDSALALIRELRPSFEKLTSSLLSLETLRASTEEQSSAVPETIERRLAQLDDSSDRFLVVMDRLVKWLEVDSRNRLGDGLDTLLVSGMLVILLLPLIFLWVMLPAIHHARTALERTRQADSSKSDFLANMSHEIRTPMTAILGYTQLLLEDEAYQDRSIRVEAIQTIQKNGKHLLSVINEILDLSKIESGKMTIEKRECSLRQLLRDVESLMCVRADAKGLSLRFELPDELPKVVMTDSVRLRQILVNLVGNAIKFTDSGSVAVRACLQEGPESRIQIEVEDSGIGMTEDQKGRLFKPFTQADTSTSRTFGGTGLGLSISKSLAEMLGGSLEIVRSVPGEGSTFSLSLPMGTSKAKLPLVGASGETPPQSEQESGPPTIEGCRLLLAEDSIDNQRLISHILKKAGAHVTLVENGKEAVDAALASLEKKEPFDVILMDMQMPVMGGYEATTLLRSRHYSLPIVALTAHAMASDREKCLDSGCDDYATKPINRAELIKTVAANARKPYRDASPQSSPL